MPTSSYIDRENDLATLTVTENISFDEIMALVEMFYDQPTKNALWDLTAVSEINLTSEEIEQIASYQQRQKSAIRIEGKTAIVASKDLIYGLGRMFQSLSEMNRVPFAVMIFRTMEEAEAWLANKDTEE